MIETRRRAGASGPPCDHVAIVVLATFMMAYGVFCVFVLQADALFIHTDAAVRLFGAILRNEVYLNGAPPAAQVLRDVSRTIEQLPALAAIRLGVDDIPKLRMIYAATLLAYYPLALAAIFFILPLGQKRLLVFPATAFVVLGLPNIIEFSSEVHFLHALAWVLFFLLLPLDNRRWSPVRRGATLLAAAASVASYESVCVYHLFFLALLHGRTTLGAGRELHDSGPGRGLRLALSAIFLVGIAANLHSILTFDAGRYATLSARVSIFMTPMLLLSLLFLGASFAAALPVAWMPFARSRPWLLPVFLAGILLCVAMISAIRAPYSIGEMRIMRHPIAWLGWLPMLLVLARPRFPSGLPEIWGRTTALVAIALVCIQPYISARSLMAHAGRVPTMVEAQTSVAGCQEIDRVGRGRFVVQPVFTVTIQMVLLAGSRDVRALIYLDEAQLSNFREFYGPIDSFDDTFFDFSALECLDN
ncbi:MAG: hypothetical protein AAF968_05405 [Pseudomonadota bacterium]